ncbi:MAG: glycosyltransferase [Cyanobium sp. PLM2.Bin73]|nr:MAG: glycosyltransferase [Cyanobium sp. PLM2.Bin73]
MEPHLVTTPLLSSVLHNPIATRLSVLPDRRAQATVAEAFPRLADEPFLFHIARRWYKNFLEVLAIWEYLHRLGDPPHLVLVGAPDASMHNWLQQPPHLAPWLHVLEAASDDLVVALYNRAAALLYPSHAEGFGWPILEALACGCPLLTTARAPMTEVGGEAASYIPPMPAPPAPLEPHDQRALALQECR